MSVPQDEIPIAVGKNVKFKNAKPSILFWRVKPAFSYPSSSYSTHGDPGSRGSETLSGVLPSSLPLKKTVAPWGSESKLTSSSLLARILAQPEKKSAVKTRRDIQVVRMIRLLAARRLESSGS